MRDRVSAAARAQRSRAGLAHRRRAILESGRGKNAPALRFAIGPRGGSCFGIYPDFCDACYDEASVPAMHSRRESRWPRCNCPCVQAHELWREFWWTEGRHRWIFFDYEQTSETYAEQVENCPACGRRLERKELLS